MIKMIVNSDVGIVPVEQNLYSDLVHTNKMFELIAMKRPVIATRTRAVEDFFGSDDCCLKYFESGNEVDLAKRIIELYNDSEKRRKMANNAFRKYESVCWKESKNEYCRIYEKLI
jgi:glycosyltransferase involved in cell wall biosynthesis